jgi:hypothetical protein
MTPIISSGSSYELLIIISISIGSRLEPLMITSIISNG